MIEILIIICHIIIKYNFKQNFLKMKFIGINIFIILLSINLFSRVTPFSTKFQEMLIHEEKQTKSIFDLDQNSNLNNLKNNSLFDKNRLYTYDNKEQLNEKNAASLFNILNENESQGILFYG